MTTTTIRSFNYPLVNKALGWAGRYLPSEVAGTCSALVCAVLAAYVGAQPFYVALASVGGEGVGFYLPLLIREFDAERVHSDPVHALWRTVRNLAVEFGAAELFDSGLLRPALMLGALHAISSLPLAVMVGKLLADVVFYTLAIGGLEARRMLFGDARTDLEA